MNYKKKDVVKCMVTAIESYGFFVNTELGYSGLVHISEMSNGYVSDITKFVSIGNVIYCTIIDIDEDLGQLKLSIKNINYKSRKKDTLVSDPNGFLPLKNMLDIWILEKEKEYK